MDNQKPTVIYDFLDFLGKKIIVNSSEWNQWVRCDISFRYSTKNLFSCPTITFFPILRNGRSYWYCRYKPHGELQRRRYVGLGQSLTVDNMKLSYDIITLPKIDYEVRQLEVKQYSQLGSHYSKAEAARKIKEVILSCRRELEPETLKKFVPYLRELEGIANTLTPKGF